MPAFQYVGAYSRFIQGVGGVEPGEVVDLPAQPPGYEWIPVGEQVPHVATAKAPDSPVEPVNPAPVSNDTPISPVLPAAPSGAIPAPFHVN